jgi:hypothetical protein
VAPPEPWPNPRLPTKEASKEKKTNHKKAVKPLQNNMDRHFNYSSMGDEGHTVISSSPLRSSTTLPYEQTRN